MELHYEVDSPIMASKMQTVIHTLLSMIEQEKSQSLSPIASTQK